jgi:kynurenine formamidase
MTTYPGLPGPQISEHMTFEESASHYAEGTEFSIATIRLVANTGTYLDTAATAVAMT